MTECSKMNTDIKAEKLWIHLPDAAKIRGLGNGLELKEWRTETLKEVKPFFYLVIFTLKERRVKKCDPSF